MRSNDFDNAAQGRSLEIAGPRGIKFKTDGVTRLELTTAGVLSGTSGFRSTSPTNGIGYNTGAGGLVTQQTNKGQGVTLDTMCGTITMNNAALAGATTVGFTLTNSNIATSDVVFVNIRSGASSNSYIIQVAELAAGSANIEVRNYTAGSLSEALLINFVIIKAIGS